MIHHVPPIFQPKHPLVYPPGNLMEFERWFFNHFMPRKSFGRTYLPIYWTNYYCANGYGQNKDSLQKLQTFLNTLPKEQYFTIVQYDDGIINDLSNLDIRVYSMSGRPMDYPLPLICQPHGKVHSKKNLFFNYVGRDTHPIRKEVMKLKGGFVSEKPLKMPQFCDVLASSVFTLCPRGYGPTSFRIMEALEQDSIPVYISDKFIIPHAIPFTDYGVLIRPEQIPDIPKILADVDPKSKTNPFQTHFTYEAVQRLIFADLLDHSTL